MGIRMKYYPPILTMLAFITAAGFSNSEEWEFFALIDKYGTVALVFLLTGLLMDDLHQAARQWKTTVFIQTFNFVLVPVFIRMFVAVISLIVSTDQWIVNGFTAVACMPPAMCSAVLLTSVAKGNEATAALNAMLGTLLGIYLTPPLLIAHMGVSSSVPTGRMIAWLILGCVLPLLTGRLLQYFVHICRPSANSVWPAALFLVNLSSFCDLFRQAHFTVTAAEFLGIVMIVIAVQILLMYISVRLLTVIHAISEENCVAVMFSSVHKTLALGVGMVNALYGGYAHVSHTSLPLVIYNAVQLILGSLIAPSALRLCSRLAQKRTLPT